MTITGARPGRAPVGVPARAMRVLMVYAHPEPRSFNGAMKDLAVDTLTGAGHRSPSPISMPRASIPWQGPPTSRSRSDPAVLDIGAEQAHAARTGGFAADVQAEMDKLLAADLLILQFPFWWYSVPAILKGWIDRVFAYGVAYDFGRTWDRGVFRGRRAMLSFTTSRTAHLVPARWPQRRPGAHPVAAARRRARIVWLRRAATLRRPRGALGGRGAPGAILVEYRERLRDSIARSRCFSRSSGTSARTAVSRPASNPPHLASTGDGVGISPSLAGAPDRPDRSGAGIRAVKEAARLQGSSLQRFVTSGGR